MTRAWPLILLVILLPASAFSDSSNLEGGVFIAHHPPGLLYTSGQDWCERYSTEFAIDSCSAQHNRIDLDGNDGEESVWFVLAAWDEGKEWCGAEFGFAQYDSTIYLFDQWGPCFPSDGLEIPMVGWPGPNRGTALTTQDEPWAGNCVPIYWLSGYAYEEGEIPLAANPSSEFGGTANCETPPVTFAAAAFGGMGLFQDGTYACPEGLGGLGGGMPPDGVEGYGGYEEEEGDEEDSESSDACAENAVIIRFAPNAISFPQDRSDPPQYFKASVADAEISLVGLDTLLTEIGAESLATTAPGWRHLTPGRSRNLQGDHVDLVDFTDVYRATLSGSMSVEDAIASLRGQPGIVYAECDALLRFYDMPAGFPHDPYYPYTPSDFCGQWYLNNDPQTQDCDCDPQVGEERVDLNAPEAWALCYEQDPPIKAGTKIGILDQCMNGYHEELGPYIDTALSGSFVTGKWVGGSEGWIGPGHGTGMAAMAGAGTDNQDEFGSYLGIASVANIPPSHAGPLLVALVNADINRDDATMSYSVAALEWVSTYHLAGIRVVNMSWGRERWKFCHDLQTPPLEDLHTLRDACRNSFRRGINLVSSAGNEIHPDPSYPPGGCGASGDTSFSYPAAFADYCLAVAALGCRGQLHTYPGPFLVGSYIDVAGPGVGVDALGKAPTDDTDHYGSMPEGTSPASPAIASAIALLLGAQPNLYNEDCYALLKATGRRYGNDKVEVGAGMPKVDEALEMVTGDHRVVHGGTASFSSTQEWSTPRPVCLRNVPPELCAAGGGEEWQQLELIAYRLTSIVEIIPPEDGAIEMVWPRGCGSSGWRLLDQTLEGDPNATPYYDVNYYENWARLESTDENEYTFVSYTYHVVGPGQLDCWVPFDPDDPEQAYNLHYSYVVRGGEWPSDVQEDADRSASLHADRAVVQRSASATVTLWLPEVERVWLGIYSVEGRLVRSLVDGAYVRAGRTEVKWDLRTVDARLVDAGLYFVRMETQAGATRGSTSRARMVVVQ